MMTMSGCVMAIGGNEHKGLRQESILREFVRRAGGDSARIVIVPFASMAPVKRGEQYEKIFRKFGAADVVVLSADTPATDGLAAFDSATGIFVTGGDQERLMDMLRQRNWVEPIRKAVYEGATYAGTSAGASAVSEEMIAGSVRERSRDLIQFGRGLGLVAGVIIDQHFNERRRLPRLITAVTSRSTTGLGIDENTAVIWENGRQFLVTGAGHVTVVQPKELEPLAEDARLPIAKPVALDVVTLLEGWSYDIANRSSEQTVETAAFL